MVKKSRAFAAFRAEVIENLMSEIREELIPNFNAEILQISAEHEELKATKGEAWADHRKHSRIMDLKVRQKEFIDGQNAELKALLSKRVADYGGEIVEVTREAEDEMNGEKVLVEKRFLEARFPSDGSTAKFPKSLYIDYSAFQRA